VIFSKEMLTQIPEHKVFSQFLVWKNHAENRIDFVMNCIKKKQNPQLLLGVIIVTAFPNVLSPYAWLGVSKRPT
jgi:hypothetical protein